MAGTRTSANRADGREEDPTNPGVERDRRRGRKGRPTVELKELQGFKFLQPVLALLRRLREHADSPNRKLHYDEYVTLLLFYFFNPVLTSLRSIQAVSELPEVRRALRVGRSSLGSLSEAARVFDPDLLAEILGDLVKKIKPSSLTGRLSEIDKILTAVDGTLLPALPRMFWALWRDKGHRAAKAHVQYEILRGIPVRADVTDGNASEKTVLRDTLQKNRLYVLDRGYAKYKLFQDILDAGSSFACRIRANAVYREVESRELTDADRAAGVLSDKIVQLGCQEKKNELNQEVRIVAVRLEQDSSRQGRRRGGRRKSSKPGDTIMLIATDQQSIPAELIALIYRQRWQIELFFRWLKRVLGCRHLLSHSQTGVSLQMYAALIACLLISLWTGQKPTKRTFELLCLHMQGWATDDDLSAHISRLKLHPDLAENPG